MLVINCIGHIGSNAECKSANGREFTTFRIAHTDRWTDDAGQVHETTTWVDCIMQGKPKVFDFLKKGTQVFVSGSMTLRVYSSAKDRCMKAGVTINVRQVELLGGKTDVVPAILYNANDGTQVDIIKYYNAPSLVRDNGEPENLPLVSKSQARFVCDRNGWVTPFNDNECAE